MRELNLKYALIFPANLKVIRDDKTWFFTEVEVAWEWLKSRFPDGAGECIRKNLRTRGNKIRKRNKAKRPTPQQSKDEQRAAVANISDLLGDNSARNGASGSGSGTTKGAESDDSGAVSVKATKKHYTSQMYADVVDSDATI